MILYNVFLLLGPIGGSETIIIILAIILIFGGRKIPELMRGIGQGIREFNSAKNNVREQIKDGMKDEPKKDEKKEEDKSESKDK